MSVNTMNEQIGSTLERLKRPVQVSFEFFPPADAQMEQTLWNSIERLASAGSTQSMPA